MNFNSMARQHEMVIMCVQRDQLSDLMVDGSKTEELEVTSERDPSEVDMCMYESWGFWRRCAVWGLGRQVDNDGKVVHHGNAGYSCAI